MRWAWGRTTGNHSSNEEKICAGTVVTAICSIMRYVNPREDENTHPFTAYQGFAPFRIELHIPNELLKLK